jgi:hypothetical protein
MPGYWWECDRNAEHKFEQFHEACGLPSVVTQNRPMMVT